MLIVFKIFFCLLTLNKCLSALNLQTFVSQNGVFGTISLFQNDDDDDDDDDDDKDILLVIDLNVTKNAVIKDYYLLFDKFPTDYSSSSLCSSQDVLFNFTEFIGLLSLPLNSSMVLTNKNLTLFGSQNSLWGRTLILESVSGSRICGALDPINSKVSVWESRFSLRIGGSVWFSSLISSSKTNDETNDERVEMRLYTSLFYLQGGGGEEIGGRKRGLHGWKIYLTDKRYVRENECEFLQIVYDPNYSPNPRECSAEETTGCKKGDLTALLGKVPVGHNSKNVFSFYDSLKLRRNETNTFLYLAIFDLKKERKILSCSRIRYIEPKVGKASFSQRGLDGTITFSQNSPFSPVNTIVNLTGLSSLMNGYHVHLFPVPQRRRIKGETHCSATGDHYNPHEASNNIEKEGATMDNFEVGDLSGKYGNLKSKNEYFKRITDPTLSLYGKYSLIGRGIVIHELEEGRRFACSNINLLGRSQITFVATFTYPIAGRIFFTQEMTDNPFADTSVFVESLLYSDGSKNDSLDHRWHVHSSPPGKDYFNWTNRCLSAGKPFNPYFISRGEGSSDNNEEEEEDCHSQIECSLGNLLSKSGGLGLFIAGKKRQIQKSVFFYTDVNLPLRNERGSLEGKSLVIYDDFGPKHRGDRLACTAIKRLYRYKAVAKDWFGNGEPSPISGRLEFIQYSEISPTLVYVNLEGLNDKANGYHVHVIPIQRQLEFPCTADAVGGHFNPWNVSTSVVKGGGSLTEDQFEVGDLSGKHGFLEHKKKIISIYNDSSLPLFGPHSIVGRSIVVHKKEKGARWACSSIVWGFDPDEATHIRAIASFHHPNGFAWGFIRFSQVIYRDGSHSSTVIEVRLKYPGKYNTIRTVGHDWSIYVNPVNHDAAVKFATARCTAGGYRWNPTHIQLAAPNDEDLYREECGPDYPLRCQVGDMSGKNGKISIGGEAYIFHDEFLTLKTEDWFTTLIGKSIVIHEKNGSSERMACANIEPDDDIIKDVVLRTKSRFILNVFLEEVAAVMGVPEWYLFIDSRQTENILGGACIKIRLHFSGPHASKLEQDFDILLRTGKLETPSISIPGYFPDPNRKTKLGYSACDSKVYESPLYENKYSFRPPMSPGSSSSLLVSSLTLSFLVWTYFYLFH